jgi:GT2 family glycosyltransferase
MDSVKPATNPQAAAEAEYQDAANPIASADLLHAMRRVFDADFYRAQTSELDADEAGLIEHFVAQGWRDGLDPAPWFSVEDYLARYDDVRLSAINPFLHYLVYGRAEGRQVTRSRASLEMQVNASRNPLSRLRGHFDGVSQGVARGWVFDPAAPTASLSVELWRDSRLLCVEVADRERSDIKAAGIGDGRHAFEIRLPRLAPQEGPIEIAAKVAGTDFVVGRALITLSMKGLRVAITSVSGMTVTVRFESAGVLREPTAIDLWIDGEKFSGFDIPPLAAGDTYLTTTQLPREALDGVAHWFRVTLRDTQTVLAEDVAVTDAVATSEDTLQNYARSFPGFLSASAQRRYIALERQLATAEQILARQAPGPERMTLTAYLVQVGAAHAQVKLGVKEQKRDPAPLTFLAFEAPLVSVVIPVHNKFWVTYNGLAALLLAPNKATFEVIVVDDASSDLTVELPQIVRNITYLRNEASLGFVKSCNRGAEAARGRYVVMLNNDTEPGPGWLDELLFVFEHFANVGMVGAKLVYPNGRLQEAGGLVFANFDVWNYGRNQNPRDPRFNYTRQVDYISGACIMVAREVWRRLDGFDEFFAPAYYEDTDLAFRIRAMGLKIYYAPFAEVVHFEGLSNGVSIETGVKRFQAVNEPKFRQRWASVIRALPHIAQPELAKDRGVALRALVIDYKTPEPDKDAGSYAAVQEMRLLQALGFKLTFAPTNLAYMGDYTEALQRQGVECLYAPYISSIEEIIRDRGAEFDVFYITRYQVAQPYIDWIRNAAPSAKIVFCNADLHFLRELRSALLGNNSQALDAALGTRDAELALMRRVDVTLTYSDTEAAVIMSHNFGSGKIARCPWVVDVQEESPAFAERSGVAFLGSFQHPPNEEAVRFFIDAVMPKLRRVCPGLKFHIYGSSLPESVAGLASDDVLIEGYAQTVESVYNRHRLFVAPLLSGAGLKGKVIGALAAGIPTVMTALAAEGVGISRGVEGAVVEAAEDWVAAIASLYGDERKWTEMAKRAQVFARENFSFARGVETMRRALSTAGVYVGE